MEGWIKLHRKIDQWGWRSKPNTFSLFMYLLTNANIEKKIYRGHTIDRGDCVIGRKALAKKIGVSEQAIRTALNHLKSTNEITIKSTNEFSVVTLLSFDLYQSKDDYITSKTTSTSTNEQPTNNQPTTTPKEGEERKEEKERGFDETIKDFKKMRKQLKKPLTDRAETRLLNKLEKIAGSDEKLKIEILEQSIFHCRQDIYPPKDMEVIPVDDEGWIELFNKVKRSGKSISKYKEKLGEDEYKRLYGLRHNNKLKGFY